MKLILLLNLTLMALNAMFARRPLFARGVTTAGAESAADHSDPSNAFSHSTFMSTFLRATLTLASAATAHAPLPSSGSPLTASPLHLFSRVWSHLAGSPPPPLSSFPSSSFRLLVSAFQSSDILSSFQRRSACQSRLLEHVRRQLAFHLSALTRARTATAARANCDSGAALGSPPDGCDPGAACASAFSSLFFLLTKQIPVLVLPPTIWFSPFPLLPGPSHPAPSPSQPFKLPAALAAAFAYNVKPDVVPLISERVSLPAVVNLVDMRTLLPPPLVAFYSDPSRCLLTPTARAEQFAQSAELRATDSAAASRCRAMVRVCGLGPPHVGAWYAPPV